MKTKGSGLHSSLIVARYKSLHEYKNVEGARVHIDGQTDDLCESVPQRGTILYEPL